jgi:hypothetical protein
VKAQGGMQGAKSAVYAEHTICTHNLALWRRREQPIKEVSAAIKVSNSIASKAHSQTRIKNLSHLNDINGHAVPYD